MCEYGKYLYEANFKIITVLSELEYPELLFSSCYWTDIVNMIENRLLTVKLLFIILIITFYQRTFVNFISECMDLQQRNFTLIN